MSSVPLLSDAQWSRIENILPEHRRDRKVITAILYREFTGQSLSQVAEVFAIARVRLHQWHHAIEADLPGIMAALRLEPASPLARWLGGSRPSHHNDSEMVAAVAAIGMQGFRDASRTGGNPDCKLV